MNEEWNEKYEEWKWQMFLHKIWTAWLFLRMFTLMSAAYILASYIFYYKIYGTQITYHGIMVLIVVELLTLHFVYKNVVKKRTYLAPKKPSM